jgi:hypothetical protein
MMSKRYRKLTSIEILDSIGNSADLERFWHMRSPVIHHLKLLSIGLLKSKGTHLQYYVSSLKYLYKLNFPNQ